MAAERSEGGADVVAALDEEIGLAGTRRGVWHAEYVGLAYRSAVEGAMARVGCDAPRVLKTDLWNECVAGDRDIVNHMTGSTGSRLFAVELSLSLCVRGRAQAPGAHVVQADIRALPFRTGAFDAVLDLSTLDHLPAAGAAAAVGEYRRVLRSAAVLLLIFWQRGALVRLRLLLKRWLGRSEKPGQRYFDPAEVRTWFGGGVAIVREFAVGSLLTPPYRLTGAVLGLVPARVRTAVLRRIVRIERSPVARGVLAPISGMRAIIAVRRGG